MQWNVTELEDWEEEGIEKQSEWAQGKLRMLMREGKRDRWREKTVGERKRRNLLTG